MHWTTAVGLVFVALAVIGLITFVIAIVIGPDD